MTDSVLLQREDENKFEHHKRLINGKMKDKTLAEYDYSELAPYIYGKQYTADETRKRMYGSAATLEILDEAGIESLTENDLIQEIQSQRLELQKEKQMMSDQRRELNKLIAQDGRRDHLYEEIVKAAQNAPNEIGRLFSDDATFCLNDSDSEFVLFLNDWHYGMVTENIWNAYDVQICKDRVRSVLDSTLARIKLHRCSRGHIVLLGDLCQGAIHVSTRVASEELVCDQLMQVSEILAQFIIILSSHVNHIDVHSTFGNHARTVANKKDNIYMDNMERIIPWWLNARIAAEGIDNVTINDNKFYEFVVFQSCGYSFCATHGDLDKVSTSTRSLPVLMRNTIGIDIDYIVLADKHHQESFEEFGVEAMLSGALCGTDEYANTKRLYSDPFQLLLIVNPECGVDARYKLGRGCL